MSLEISRVRILWTILSTPLPCIDLSWNIQIFNLRRSRIKWPGKPQFTAYWIPHIPVNTSESLATEVGEILITYV